MRRSGMAWITMGARSGNSSPMISRRLPGLVRPDRQARRVGIRFEVNDDQHMIDRVEDGLVADAVFGS